MNIKQYIAETERSYHYRIKTVFELDNEAMDRIDRTVLKYQPIDIAAPKKTMFQSQPLDFPTIDGAEVYIVDIILGLPASAYILQQELRMALSVPEKFVVVKAANEPTELETERLNAEAEMDAEAAKQGLAPGALLTIPDYAEAPETPAVADLYGDAYNSKLLGYLFKIEQERLAAMQAEPQHALFSWLDMPKADAPAEDFNTGIAGAPKAASTAGDTPPGTTAPYGNHDEDHRSYRRAYQTQDGTPKVLSRKGNPIRKDR